ncbi:precorrin-3B synthase [Microvirga sp. CF3062]|uniref:precorrin-3B synthase n=1 Tax=Microvirga sp. CF3062 TaxID=3110182 RepID=UPI002E7A2AA5|nr:precorrin-3B synthase [Microvirga sp. CF3062]MEE1655127.1 precorrin-3B synthase [Microvirga sp. CF3062]
MSAQGHITRRGWCPGVRRPMATGDGLLVRLHPFAGRLSADQARLVAQAAREHGNGHLDITARGNLQIRGVREDTYSSLLALLEHEGLAEPEGDGPNRLTVLSPLAGLDPLDRCDVPALAQAIENAVSAIEDLPAKFFVTIDGGGAMPLDALGADLHLLAIGENAITFGISSSNGLHLIGTSPLSLTPDAVHTILSGFAELRRKSVTDLRRLRDLEPDRVRELAARAALGPVTEPATRPATPRAGVMPIDLRQAVLLALPFGRCSSGQLVQVADWSERFGSGEIRLSFTRGLLLPKIADEHVPELIDEAGRAGFITEADDARLSLVACPGKPDCGGALTAAPADALRIAEACGDLLRQGATLHVSGCPKGCAHPGKADLTLVGRDDGRYDVVPDGSTRDASSIHLSIDEIMLRLSTLTSTDALRHAFPESTR